MQYWTHAKRLRVPTQTCGGWWWASDASQQINDWLAHSSLHEGAPSGLYIQDPEAGKTVDKSCLINEMLPAPTTEA